MSDQFLSLLDITARRGTDGAVGLVEEVVTFAPEIEKVMGRPIPGTNYLARVRTAYTAKAAFRKANSGSDIGSSSFEQKRFDCFAFDTEMQVDEAITRAAEANGDSAASVLADEATGSIRAKAILLGKQFYNGTTTDANGFPGLADFLTTQTSVKDPLTNAAIDQVVDAGGSAAGKCERAWFVWMHPQGVHFLFGGNAGLDIKPWALQQVKDSTGKSLMAWVSNIFGYIGLSCAHIRAVGCIKNIDNTLTNNTAAKPISDSLIATALSKFPVGIRPNLCFMSRATRRELQKGRTVTLFGQGKGRPDQEVVAPVPTVVDGDIPIIVTDSIPLENQV